MLTCFSRNHGVISQCTSAVICIVLRVKNGSVHLTFKLFIFSKVFLVNYYSYYIKVDFYKHIYMHRHTQVFRVSFKRRCKFTLSPMSMTLILFIYCCKEHSVVL